MNTQPNKERFINIISQNKKLIYKVCNSYCRDADDRQDLVQEVIIRLWQAFDKYDDNYKLSTWMYRIALNTAISHYRSGKRRNESTIPLTEHLIDIADDDSAIELDDQVKQLYAFIDELDIWAPPYFNRFMPNIIVGVFTNTIIFMVIQAVG